MLNHKENYHPPIFCDHCATLALAELHDAPLCQACLMEEIANLSVDDLEPGLRPLRFEPPLVDAGSRSLVPTRKVA